MATNYTNSIYTLGTVTYQDLDISMKANPFTGDLRTVTNADAVKQSIMTLLYTEYGERPFRPNLGGGVHGQLFEPLDLVTQMTLTNSITNVIQNWEPRVNIISLQVTEDPNNNALAISMTFNMVNITTPLQLNMLLQRTR